ncbi:hypothetical protein CL634_03155 [bacterium]|nr:hypothetical protein [bacterium]|tara:strand:- start:545 stop:754 length:210 start_codon:yes stop_codon:yes gene_type:complete
MPLPDPKGRQGKGDFISSCMSNDKMKGEFPNEKQRLAVCYSQYKRAKRSDGSEADWEAWFIKQKVIWWD